MYRPNLHVYRSIALRRVFALRCRLHLRIQKTAVWLLWLFCLKWALARDRSTLLACNHITECSSFPGGYTGNNTKHPNIPYLAANGHKRLTHLYEICDVVPYLCETSEVTIPYSDWLPSLSLLQQTGWPHIVFCSKAVICDTRPNIDTLKYDCLHFEWM